jgi:hypothetical protein
VKAGAGFFASALPLFPDLWQPLDLWPAGAALTFRATLEFMLPYAGWQVFPSQLTAMAALPAPHNDVRCHVFE